MENLSQLYLIAGESAFDTFLSQNIYFLSFILFLIGASIGSFINMLCYRIPIMIIGDPEKYDIKKANSSNYTTLPINLYSPPSHCPKCKNKIKWLHNIPIISYLLLSGKCKFCNERIPKQYFFIESISASLFASVFLLEPSVIGIYLLIFISFLIPLFIIDLKHYILPDDITLTGLWVALIINSLAEITLVFKFIPLYESVLGAAWGYLFLWTINFIFLKTKGINGMGHGDFKTLSMIGAFVGILAIQYIIIISSLLTILFYTISLFIKKENWNWKKALPFGPSLVTSSFLYIFWMYFI